MILQSLYDLYGRLSTEPKYKIAPFGYSLQKIVFRVILHHNGRLHAIEDARIKGAQEKLVPRQVCVLGHTKPPGSGLNPCFLWDTSAYMLGYKPGNNNLVRTASAFKAFREKHLSLMPKIQCAPYQAVCNFLNNWTPIQSRDWRVLDEVGPGYGVFQIIGHNAFVHDNPTIQDWWIEKGFDESSVKEQCLITGEILPIARLQYKIKKVGAQGESQIVAFNAPAFESYGKKQSFNAPISEDAAFRYATALNAVLDGPMSYKHRFTLGDATIIFWTKEPTNIEDIFARFASGNITTSTSNEVQDEAVRHKLELFFKALRKGREAYPELDENVDHTPFYLLGLTGQAKGRIGVRFFYQDRLSTLLDNLRRHYADMKIIRQFDENSQHPNPEFPALWQLLDETCPRRKRKPDRKHIPPILEGPLLRAVIAGTPYPHGLFTAVMRRVQADREVNFIRACVIAGYLRRNLKKEVSMSLDEERTDPSYRLGRLFAVLEKVQREALGKIGATIRDRFFSAASATPGVVFPRILRTYQHHLAKLPEGLKIIRERLVQEILAPVEDFPSHLNLVEQGLFDLGYYHQSKELWTAKEKKEIQKGE